jgi:hypothetical protein
LLETENNTKIGVKEAELKSAQWIHIDAEKKQRPAVVDLETRGGEISI